VVTGYLDVLRKAWVWIIALVVLGGCVGYGVSLATSKTYQGTAQLFVLSSAPSNPDLTTTANQNTMAEVQSLPTLATSPQVTARVISQLHLRITNSELAGKITADAPAGKVLINVRVTDHDPVMAARLTNAVAIQFIDIARLYLGSTSSRHPQFGLSMVHPATVPSTPISPDRQLDTELGLLAGLALAIVAVLLRAARRATPGPAAEPALAA
jgi:capsular polysaccharide biosynthesis protein